MASPIATDFFESLVSGFAGEMDSSTRRRAEYSSDASNYRVVPDAVLFPKTESDVELIIAEAVRTRTAVTARGAGTSVAGNAVGPGWVVDFSRHMNRIIHIDPLTKTAIVEPGVVLADLQAAALPFGLRFGPDPSTKSRCTIGGMIGNNACGARSGTWGTTARNVVSIRMIDGRGRITDVADGFEAYPELEAFTSDRLALLRTEFGRFARQVSGYSLQHLLPEGGRHLAHALVGTEGTCGIVLRATVRLVDIPSATALAVLGYEDTPTAAEDLASIAPLHPMTIESMDRYLVEVVRAHHGSVPDLPEGGAWLFVETAGETPEDALAAAQSIADASSSLASRVVSDGPESRALWSIREDGVGLAGRTASGEPAWPGWEDAAVPPSSIAAYLREFEQLKTRHGVEGFSYGHLGEGCVHTRLDFALEGGVERFREFLVDAATLVVAHGGSLSGEHGDGRARSELLPLMYSASALEAMSAFKRIFDPHGVLNPGIVVEPRPATVDLRLTAVRRQPAELALAEDGGDFSRAIHRCVGVGKCRADSPNSGDFMCPSYLATKDEKDSTRGRARVLQEMINGTLITGGWKSPEVADALDLCLSCKACASDCPAGVDMAAYKTEALYQKYRGRLRPISHYSLGALPRWVRLAGLAPWVVNSLARVRPLMRPLLRAAGMDPRREIPRLPRATFRRWWRGRAPVADTRPRVALWIDTFTNSFSPEIAKSAVAVLESAGYEVVVTQRQQCCGLTWITTGQLDTARRLLRASLEALEPVIDEGLTIIGLEPSCAAVLKSDLLELLPDDPRSVPVARAVKTLAEFLQSPESPHQGRWSIPSLEGSHVVAQPHCHQHAVFGWSADEKLLLDAGAQVTKISGCCGLAGNFGMEAGHYDVSVQVAENGLLPALRAHPESELLADGFSCRTQADQLADRQGKHLAQLLADAAER